MFWLRCVQMYTQFSSKFGKFGSNSQIALQSFHHLLIHSMIYLFQVSGIEPAKPVSSFAHFGFDDALLTAVRKSSYTQPTPIQAQVSVHKLHAT